MAPAPADETRLRWQCRRGMRELDELLLGWFDARYRVADDGEKAAFRQLLALSDPELIRYLLYGEGEPTGAAADVIRQIRGRAGNQ